MLMPLDVSQLLILEIVMRLLSSVSLIEQHQRLLSGMVTGI